MNHIIQPKSPSYDDVAVILLHAGERKNRTSCALSFSKGEYLINSQVKYLLDKYPKVEIIVVLGYQCDTVLNSFKYSSRTKVVENENYANTSSARSVLQGMRVTNRSKMFLLYGDSFSAGEELVLDKNSYLVVGNTDDRIGVVMVNNDVTNLAYGLECPRFRGKLFLANSEDVGLFKKSYKRGKLIHEVLNNMIDQGCKFKAKYE